MAQSTVSQITIPERKLKDFCNSVWIKLGVPKKDAETTTDVLVLADLRGVDSHGVARLPRYYTDLKNGWTKPTDESRIVRETKATAMIEGGQSLGQARLPDARDVLDEEVALGDEAHESEANGLVLALDALTSRVRRGKRTRTSRPRCQLRDAQDAPRLSR